MAIATPYLREQLAARVAALATHVSLHTADPGTTGANEVTGGSPAYARKAVTWIAGTTDGVYTSSPMDFDVPANTSVVYAGLWTALTAGTYLDKASVHAEYIAQGVFRLSVVYTQA